MELIVLTTLLVLVQGYLLAYLLYLWVPALAAAATARAPHQTPTVRTPRRFAVLASAHNEAPVIGALLRSLEAQEYPRTQLRVFVVANHCTDTTAEVVRSSPIGVCHERSGDDAATKGAALAWLWQEIAPDVADCDYVLILDADNVVAPNFLREMNEAFGCGDRVVQSARRAKNAHDTWTSELDAVSEALWNRLDQAGRARLGLSASIAGSGMAFEREVFDWLVRAGGPGLLEDIEWQARLSLAGIRVGYAESACVYDEKTGNAAQLGRQRKRWVAGIVVAARQYGIRLFTTGIRSGNLSQLMAAFAVSKPPRSILLAGMGLLAVAGVLLPGLPGLLPWYVWVAALGSFGAYVLLGMILDRAAPRTYVALLRAPVFVALMMWASVAGALRASKERWIATTHTRNITIDELQAQ